MRNSLSTTIAVALALFAPTILAAPAIKGKDPEEARRKLTRAVLARSDDGIKASLETLVNAGGKANIQAILKILPKVPSGEDAIYWDLIRGACRESGAALLLASHDRDALEQFEDVRELADINRAIDGSGS